MTAEEIVDFLEKNGRSTVKMIGTDNATMYALEKAGAVEKDGIIRMDGAGRGRPPTAWIVANGEKAAEIKTPSKRVERGSPEHTAKMHEGKRKAAEEREKAALKAKKDQLKEMKKKLPSLIAEHQKAFQTAVKTKATANNVEKMHKAFNKADATQNVVINTSRRINELEKELA